MTNATTPEFELCTDPRPGQCVHVEGWNKNCVFQYVRDENGEAILVTPKTRKEYRTRNRLLNTRKHSTNTHTKNGKSA